MKYKNNLSDVCDNSYFEVLAPFDVYLLVGYCNSNTHVGASMLFGNVYRKQTLKPRDEIHDLMGGTFAVIDGKAYTVRMAMRAKHPFEKNYGNSIEQWPVDHLWAIGASEAADASYNTKLPKLSNPPAPGLQPHGYGIDYLLPEAVHA